MVSGEAEAGWEEDLDIGLGITWSGMVAQETRLDQLENEMTTQRRE